MGLSHKKWKPTIPISLTPSYDLLRKINQDISNRKCADCSIKEPEWCSINLGVVICIGCSGIHRSFGSHISKVRSLTLDFFTPEAALLLSFLGNSKANSIWDNLEQEKPKESDSKEIKRLYIQAKYVEKKFIKKSNQDPSELLLKAIKQNDLPKALEAIVSGADVNKPYPLSMLSQPVSLIPRFSSVCVPVLDIEGNPYPNRTIKVDLPCMPQSNKEYYVIRYPIHLALYKNDLVMVEFLFQYGSDTNKKDNATGCLLADLIGYGHHVIQEKAFDFLNFKTSSKGQSVIVQHYTVPNIYSQV